MAYTETALYVDSTAWTAVTPWAASTAYTVGQIRRQLATPAVNNERCWICEIAGTSTASEPSWGLGRGAAITETGGLRWRECTGQPALNGDNANTNAWKSGINGSQPGSVIKNTAGTHYFLCASTNGIISTTEPSWNTTTGATTIEGSGIWTCIGPVGSFTTKWAAPCARLRLPLNAATSWLVNADMTVFVGDDHAEANTSGTTFAAGANCQIICIDHTAALPAGSGDLRTTGAVIDTASMSFLTANSVYVYGLRLSGNAALQFGTGGSRHYFEQCLFSETNGVATTVMSFGDGSASGQVIEYKNCTFSSGAAGQAFRFRGGMHRLENCTLAGTIGGSAQPVFSSNILANVLVEGCDLSNIPNGSQLIQSSGGTSYWCFKDCKLPASFTVIGTGDAAAIETQIVDLVRCDSGATNYRNERHARNGGQTTSTSVIRTGGASDGVTAVSHKIDTTANALDPYQRFGALPLTIWNDVTGTNRTVTLYGMANDSRVPTDGEVWFDAEYLGQSGSPDGDYKRGYKANVLATAAPLTADTSAWDVALSSILTWEPTTATAVTLSGGNLVATNTGTTSADQGVRVADAAGKTSGKYYFEATWTTLLAGNNVGVGIGTPASTYTNMGNNATIGTEVFKTGSVYSNGSSVLTWTAWASGATMGLAVDFDNRKFWVRTASGGNWNNSGTADPATNTGGLTIPAGTMVPFVTFGGTSGVANNVITANFGASAFVGAVPSGFTSGWPAASATRANSTPYTVGQAIKVASNPGRVFFCTGAGTSASSEPASSAITWDTATVTAVTLSGGNLVATNTGTTSADQGARAATAAGQIAGKYYFETTYTTVAGGANCGVGIGTTTSTYTNMGGNATVGDMTFRQTGNIYSNGINTSITLAVSGSGTTICVAVDLDNLKIWFRKAPSGLWNNSSTADPATNVGGVTIPSGAIVPFCTFGGTGGVANNVLTANFGASAFSGAVPSGFVAWNAGYSTYASAVDGSVVIDGTAQFRAACRFRQTLTLNSPQPAQAGYLYVTPRFARASQTYYLDPKIVLG